MNWLSLLFPSTWNPLNSLYDLFSRETRISTQAVNDLFIQATVCIALFFVIWALILTVKSKSKVMRYWNVLKKEDADAKAEIESSKLPLFEAFQRHFVRPPNLDGTDRITLRRTVDAAEIFSDSALAPGFIGSRLFLAIPGILTGLGVLGTFVGLQIGIGGLDLRDIKNLEHSIIPLIQGCAVAFSTSVWGVTCSLLFSIFEKFLEGWTLGKIRKLQNRVDALIPRYVPEEAMAEMERSSRGTEEILKGLAVAIGDEMQKAIGRLGTEIKTAVSQATSEGHAPLMEKSAQIIAGAITVELGNLKKQISEMSDEFSKKFSGANDELMGSIKTFEPTVKKLSDAVEKTQGTVTTAVEKLNAHEAVMEKMSSAATEIHQASESFAETKQTMLDSAQKNKEAADAQNSAAQVNERVAERFDRVGERLPDIQKALDQLTDTVKTLSETVGNTAKTVSDAVEKLNAHEAVMEKMSSAATEIHQASQAFAETKQTMLDSAEKNKDAADAQNSAAQINKDVAGKFEQVGERLPDVQETIKDAARVIASISGPLGELKTYLKELPEKNKEFQKEINTSSTKQTESLLSDVEKLTKEVSKAAQEFSNVGGLAEKLEGAAKHLDDASNGLSVFGNQVSNASQKQLEASNAAREAASASKKTAELLEPLPARITELNTGLQKAGDSVRSGAEAARDSYKELVVLQEKWFKGVEIGLNAIKERVQSIIAAYGNQIEGQTRNLMNQWTEEVTKCLKTYQTQLADLQGDLDELQKSLSRMRNR